MTSDDVATVRRLWLKLLGAIPVPPGDLTHLLTPPNYTATWDVDCADLRAIVEQGGIEALILAGVLEKNREGMLVLTEMK
jgi:hypothetical protein